MEEQKAILEAEVLKVREGQRIMEARFEEMRLKAEEERKEQQAIYERRNKAIQAAETDMKMHSGDRTAKRVVHGILGATAIVLTGGWAAPIVLATAGVAEAKYNGQKQKDRKDWPLLCVIDSFSYMPNCVSIIFHFALTLS
jgi:hypothetical protein